MPIPVIIDCDPGTDDAIALLLAFGSPELDIRAITVAGGNAGLERTLANALSLAALAGSAVAVHGGADRPLLGAYGFAPEIHGDDGLGGIALPAGGAPASSIASDAIRDSLRHAKEPVTLVGIGPVTNIALALIAAVAFHLLPFVSDSSAQWIADNLKNALVINVVLAIFNMLPIPPLDGGRVAVGLLPNVLAVPLSRLEPFGMLILIGFLILLPVIGAQLGLNLDVISAILRTLTGTVIRFLLLVTGNA
jgi:Zn-dependent protease